MRKKCNEKKSSFGVEKKQQQEVGDDLGVCVLNLKMV